MSDITFAAPIASKQNVVFAGEDGLLPTSLFKRIFISYSAGFPRAGTTLTLETPDRRDKSQADTIEEIVPEWSPTRTFLISSPQGSGQILPKRSRTPRLPHYCLMSKYGNLLASHRALALPIFFPTVCRLFRSKSAYSNSWISGLPGTVGRGFKTSGFRGPLQGEDRKKKFSRS